MTTQPRDGDGSQWRGRMALSRREAAKAIGISERKLWSMTVSGEVPHAKLGRRVIYPIDKLRQWMDKHTKGGKS